MGFTGARTQGGLPPFLLVDSPSECLPANTESVLVETRLPSPGASLDSIPSCAPCLCFPLALPEGQASERWQERGLGDGAVDAMVVCVWGGNKEIQALRLCLRAVVSRGLSQES